MDKFETPEKAYEAGYEEGYAQALSDYRPLLEEVCDTLDARPEPEDSPVTAWLVKYGMWVAGSVMPMLVRLHELRVHRNE